MKTRIQVIQEASQAWQERQQVRPDPAYAHDEESSYPEGMVVLSGDSDSFHAAIEAALKAAGLPLTP